MRHDQVASSRSLRRASGAVLPLHAECFGYRRQFRAGCQADAVAANDLLEELPHHRDCFQGQARVRPARPRGSGRCRPGRR